MFQCITKLFLLEALSLFASNSYAVDLYVNPGQSIQAAIDTAVYGDTVHVAAGTYVENIIFKTGISLIGADSKTTVIDGNQNGTVVTVVDCDSNTMLDGFTLTNGTGTSDDNFTFGGGLYCANSVLKILNCTFCGNSAGYGGGIFVSNAKVILHDSRFSDNTAEFGGAIFEDDSDIEICRSRFIGNTAGAYLYSSGGALFCSESSARITDCTFIGNKAQSGGGAMVIFGPWDSSMGEYQDIINCIMTQNTAGSYGGAIAAMDGADPYFISCTIAGNRVIGGYGSGGAISCTNAYKPGYYLETFVFLENSIVWNNSAVFGSQLALGDPLKTHNNYCAIGLSYTDLQESNAENYGAYLGEPEENMFMFVLYPEEGSVFEYDPLFVDPNGLDGIIGTEDDDLHLLPWSPCIDAGLSEGYYVGPTDIDGQDRIFYDTIDIGADEVFPIAGDIDQDEDVDLDDFHYFAGHWMKGI